MINPTIEETISDIILRIINLRKINSRSANNNKVEIAGIILAIIKNFL